MKNRNKEKPYEKEIKAILKKRKTKILTPGGAKIDVTFCALDLLNIIKDIKYCEIHFDTLSNELSRMLINKLPNKNIYWDYASYNNCDVGRVNIIDLNEVLRIMSACMVIDSHKNGYYFVTEEGKNIINKAIIESDSIGNNNT